MYVLKEPDWVVFPEAASKIYSCRGASVGNSGRNKTRRIYPVCNGMLPSCFFAVLAGQQVATEDVLVPGCNGAAGGSWLVLIWFPMCLRVYFTLSGWPCGVMLLLFPGGLDWSKSGGRCEGQLCGRACQGQRSNRRAHLQVRPAHEVNFVECELHIR